MAHIHRMLRERESVFEDDDWVLNEAMDMHSLQTGGTFMNTLTRKLDDIIIPRLAEIIAFVDRRCNLSLLQKVQHTPLSQFWLRIFTSKRAEEALTFTGSQKVQMIDENFACEFPFSWLVKELMDSHWDSAQSTGGMSYYVALQLNYVVYDTLQVPAGNRCTNSCVTSCQTLVWEMCYSVSRMRTTVSSSTDDIFMTLYAVFINVSTRWNRV